MLNAGTFLQNRYEIISRIGAGGMADVYKAKDHKLNRFVAVKVLKEEFRGDKAFLSKFRVEAQAAAGLSHSNIVNVYDVGADQGVNFIVMELVEGITLKNYIAKKGKLSVREATSIMLQVAAGLEAAHNNGIVHRDVKPQNILISMDGKAKIADFGIARAANSNTINSSAMGSVHYCAPEQTRGGYSDAKSDIYSMGVTMFEMLTGRVPFDGDTTVEVALRHLQEDFPSPRKFTPEIPFSTEQIVLKCTQKSPDRRYNNMSELIRDLKESLVNPGGNFVVIPTLDRKAHTVMLSKDEVNQLKNTSLPSYDNQLDTGAAGTMTETGSVSGDNRQYPYGGTYYQNSGYQDLRHNQEAGDLRRERIGNGRIGNDMGANDRSWDGRGGNDRMGNRYAGDPGANGRIGSGGRYGVRSGYGPGEELEEEYPEYLSEYGQYNDDYRENRGRRKRRSGDDSPSHGERVVTVISIIAAVAVGLLILYFVGRAVGIFKSNSGGQSGGSGQTGQTESDGHVQVPDVLGKTETQAQQLLSDAGLGFKYLGESPSTDYAKGQVLSQSVEAGASVDKNTTIGYVLSAGDSTTIKVPSLTNVSSADAEKILRGMGLLVSVDTSRYSDKVEEGNVITTNPGEGSTVMAGDTVTVYVSQGSDVTLVEVPLVEGHYSQDAKNMLSNYGLYAYITEVYSDSVDRDIVISQDPAAGTRISSDTPVTITVSLGSAGSDVISVYDSGGPWMCNAQLKVPDGHTYEGQPVQIILRQGEDSKVVYEGSTAFPYVLNVEGQPGITTGSCEINLLDPTTWEITETWYYENVEFYPQE